MITHSKPFIIDEDIEDISNVLRSKMIANGNLVKIFESNIAEYFNYPSSVVSGNGTYALVLALKALEIGNGDEVIVPTYVCESVLRAVKSVGAKAVLCDIGENWCVEKENVMHLLSPKTKAIIVVHIFGIAADVEDFLSLGVDIIEDCCQAFGTEFKGKKVGTFGDIGFFSFHSTKCLTTGEGGAVIAKKPEIQSKIRKLSNNSVISGLTDLQAALGISQLKRYSDFLKIRREIAERYLSDLPNNLTNNINEIKNKTIFFRFLLRSDKINDFISVQRRFEDQGTIIRKGVDQLLHRMLEIDDKQFPNAVKLFNETISIPIYPSLKENEIGIIIESVNNIYNSEGL
ncbi:MAG: DegT/DnrJ/EryC1/StrS family aminotransferase [Deltaproteobacteria bacterium]